MSLTLLVSNLFPKSRFVIAVYPVALNIPNICVTLPVSKLSPKSKLVIDLYPVYENILFIFVTLLTFSKPIFVIVSVDVQFSA